MTIGRSGAKGRGLRARPIWFFCLAPFLPHLYDKGNFLTPFLPLRGPHEASTHHVKLYFLLICPTTITIFLIKYVSLMKIYLKLKLNLSNQIKLFFSKN